LINGYNGAFCIHAGNWSQAEPAFLVSQGGGEPLELYAADKTYKTPGIKEQLGVSWMGFLGIINHKYSR